MTASTTWGGRIRRTRMTRRSVRELSVRGALARAPFRAAAEARRGVGPVRGVGSVRGVGPVGRRGRGQRAVRSQHGLRLVES